MQHKIKANHEEKEPTINMQSFIEKIADANSVIGKMITTNNGNEIIPISSITFVHMGGSGEYGDIKTFKEADGFKLAGANGTLVSIKPKGFLVNTNDSCRLIKVEENYLESVIDKTQDIISKFNEEM